MSKLKSVKYLLFNLKIVVKILIALYKKPKQTVQELCDTIGTDDDLLLTKIITELKIIKIVEHNEYVLEQLESISAVLLGKYSINTNFLQKAINKAG